MCEIKVTPISRGNTNAAKLLVGLQEEDLEDIQRQVHHIVLLAGSLVTCSLEERLIMHDPNVPIYSDGLARLKKVLNSADYLSGTPLEAAYTWVLSCHSALKGGLSFANKEFRFNLNIH